MRLSSTCSLGPIFFIVLFCHVLGHAVISWVAAMSRFHLMEREKKAWRRSHASFLIFRPWNGINFLCSYFVGKNLVIWPQLTARKVGNYKIAGQSGAQEEGENKFWWTPVTLCHFWKHLLHLLHTLKYQAYNGRSINTSELKCNVYNI